MGKIPFLLLLFPGFVLFFFHPTTRRPTLPPLLAPCWDHGFSRCHLKLLLLRSSMNSWQHLHAPTPSTWPPVLLAERTTTRSTWLVPASLARRIEVGHGGWPAGLQGELVSYISVTHIAFPTYVLSRWVLVIDDGDLVLVCPYHPLLSLLMYVEWSPPQSMALYFSDSCGLTPHLHNRRAFIINDGDSGPCGQMISLLLSCLVSPVWFLFQLFHGMITSSSE